MGVTWSACLFGNFPTVLFRVFVLGCVVGRGGVVFVLLTHSLVEHGALFLLDALGRVLGHALLVENLHTLSESRRIGSVNMSVFFELFKFSRFKKQIKTNLGQTVDFYSNRVEKVFHYYFITNFNASNLAFNTRIIDFVEQKRILQVRK